MAVLRPTTWGAGQYDVAVSGLDGRALGQEIMATGPSESAPDIELPQRKDERPGGVVSVTELLHPPPKSAVKSVEHAAQLSEAGRREEAAAELEKAVQTAPEFAAARNNLGVQYMYLRRYEQAVAQFEAAARIAPGARVFANLAIALDKSGRPAEAEQAARRAVWLDGGNAKAHLALGCLLAPKGRSRQEAVRELTLAAGEEPSAYLVLANVYTTAGETQKARESLDAYRSKPQKPR